MLSGALREGDFDKALTLDDPLALSNILQFEEEFEGEILWDPWDFYPPRIFLSDTSHKCFILGFLE